MSQKQKTQKLVIFCTTDVKHYINTVKVFSPQCRTYGDALEVIIDQNKAISDVIIEQNKAISDDWLIKTFHGIDIDNIAQVKQALLDNPEFNKLVKDVILHL
jgi:hypothetical protein